MASTPRTPCSVMKVEVQEVPVHQEPKKADAADGEQGVPNLVPDPLRRVGPGLDGANDGEQRANSAKDTDHLQEMDLPAAIGSQLKLL